MKTFTSINQNKGSVNDTDKIIVVQRQGCSQTLNVSHHMFYGSVGRHYGYGTWFFEVCYGSDRSRYMGHAGQIFECDYKCDSLKDAKVKMLRSINKLSGNDYALAAFVQDYMYSFGISYDYCESDKIISPLRFDPELSAIVDVADKTVAFWIGTPKTRDEFRAVNIPAFCEQTDHVLNAIRDGFHDCDYKKGMDFCMRRLTWLAGQYVRQSKGSGECVNMILGRNMEAEA